MRSILLLVGLTAAGIWLVGLLPLPPALTVLLYCPVAWLVADWLQPG